MRLDEYPKGQFDLDGLILDERVEFRPLRSSGRKRPMAEERIQRLFAAILAANVVGYSLLTCIALTVATGVHAAEPVRIGVSLGNRSVVWLGGIRTDE